MCKQTERERRQIFVGQLKETRQLREGRGFQKEILCFWPVSGPKTDMILPL